MAQGTIPDDTFYADPQTTTGVYSGMRPTLHRRYIRPSEEEDNAKGVYIDEARKRIRREERKRARVH